MPETFVLLHTGDCLTWRLQRGRGGGRRGPQFITYLVIFALRTKRLNSITQDCSFLYPNVFFTFRTPTKIKFLNIREPAKRNCLTRRKFGLHLVTVKLIATQNFASHTHKQTCSACHLQNKCWKEVLCQIWKLLPNTVSPPKGGKCCACETRNYGTHPTWPRFLRPFGRVQ